MIIGVGDVWAVDTGSSLVARVIRLGERMSGKSDKANHVVIVHHQDAAGTWWGIEGRPGGVGWVDLANYEGTRYLNTNAAEPRTDAQRLAIAGMAVGLLGTGYDWVGGITADLDVALHMPDLAKLLDDAWGWHSPDKPGQRAGHVVCSSAATWIYTALTLACPKLGELTMPGDWWTFNHGLAGN